MATRSMIGYWNKNTGEVTASYCHYDGYPVGVGAVLAKYYTDPANAEQIAKIGYMSCLESNYAETAEAAVHKNEEPVPYESVDQFMKNGYDYAGAEYLYIFDGATWFVASRYGESKFTDVLTVLSEGAAA